MRAPVFYTTTPSIGDLICATPTIRKISKTYRSKVIVVSPSPWILNNNPFVSQSLHINDFSLEELEKNYDVHKSFHLLGKRDSMGIEFKHAICDIRQFHSKDLGFMLTPEELTCDYFPEEFNSCMQGIDLPEKYVAIHPVQSWESRTWEEEKWRNLCERLVESGVTVVSVGKNSGEYSDHLKQDKPVFKIDSVIDYTNKTTLDQTWHILNKASCVVTMDSGILHLTGTTDTPIVQLGSSIHPYFRAPYRKGSQSYKYSYVPGSCKIHCASNLEYSLRDWGNIQSVTLIHTCLENKPSFECKPSSDSTYLEVMKYWENLKTETKENIFFIPEEENTGKENFSIEEKFEDPRILVSFRNGPEVDIQGNPLDPRVFKVFFYDDDTNEIVHESSIKINHWTKSSRKYFTNWRIEIWDGIEKIHESSMELEGKEVCLMFSTSTLGDTISWVAYAEEFRKKHKCNLTLYCSFSKIFELSYPEIIFIERNSSVWEEMEDEKWYAVFPVIYGVKVEDQRNQMMRMQRNFESKRGLLYAEGFDIHDEFKNPRHPHSISLSSIGSDALGLDEKEIRTRIKNPNPSERPMGEKYICISEFASAEGLKLWNNKIGWETLVEKLQSLGYKVVSISKEKSNLKGIIKRNGPIDLEERIWYLHHCEFFIGVSSGLSWLAWACGKKVVMISGATMDFNEFREDNIRIINKESCHGCWNSEEHMNKFACFHASFCPENKNFECTRKISPSYVLAEMQKNGLI
jgi:ADP-heptose:LPS heptosyltransferase